MSQRRKNIHQFLINLHFITAPLKFGLGRDSLKAVRVIGGIVSVPKVRSVFVARKLFGQRINLLLLVVRNIFAQNPSGS